MYREDVRISRKRCGGKIFLEGREITNRSPHDAMMNGIVYVPNSMFADTEEIDAAYDAMKEGSWIAFPDASELRLGHHMALRFAREFLSEEQCERVVAIFSRRGAFRRFKDFLDECGKLQEWYAYEELTVLEALKQWLKDNDIDYVDDRPLSEEAQRIAALQR